MCLESREPSEGPDQGCSAERVDGVNARVRTFQDGHAGHGARELLELSGSQSGDGADGQDRPVRGLRLVIPNDDLWPTGPYLAVEQGARRKRAQVIYQEAFDRAVINPDGTGINLIAVDTGQ